MSDLDLLVGPDNLKPAIRLLSEAGYIEAGCIDAADEHLRACHEVFRRWYNALGFRHPASGVRVDLHWAFAPAGFPGNPDAADFMRQARLTLLQGYPVRSLAPEDNLVFLCAHGAKHAWAGLNWVVDICGLIRRSTGFRYDRVLAGCGRSPALKRMVWIGLLLADFVLDGAEPALAEFCRHAPDAARRSAAIFLDRFASGPGAKNGAQDRLSSRLRLPYAVSGSARASAAYVLAQIIAPQEADWNSWRIGWRPAFFLYYPWRLARLGWKWRPRLIRESAGTL